MELILMINTISLLFFASIFYISITENFSSKEDAKNPIMVMCWLMWIYAVPISMMIVNIFVILNTMITYFKIILE